MQTLTEQMDASKRGACRQLSSMYAAGAVPGTWNCHEEAMPRQRGPAASRAAKSSDPEGRLASLSDATRMAQLAAYTNRHHHPPSCDPAAVSETLPPLTRRQRAHWRFSWDERLARNACSPLESPDQLHLGIPPAFVTFLGATSL